jgi:hypothetical protein
VDLEGVNGFKGSQTLDRVNRLRGRVNDSEGVYLQVQMGERHIPRLS